MSKHCASTEGVAASLGGEQPAKEGATWPGSTHKAHALLAAPCWGAAVLLNKRLKKAPSKSDLETGRVHTALKHDTLMQRVAQCGAARTKCQSRTMPIG